MDIYAQVIQSLKEAVAAAMRAAIASGELPEAALPDFIIEIPADTKNGDFEPGPCRVAVYVEHLTKDY